MKIYAEKTFAAIKEELPKILGWLEEKSDEFFTFPVALKIQLAGEEAIVNVISYAYEGVKDNTRKPLTLILGCDDDGMLFLELRDSGKPFDPLVNISADPTLALEERELGGWGRALITKTMDDATYKYVYPENVLHLKKKNIEDCFPDIP